MSAGRSQPGETTTTVLMYHAVVAGDLSCEEADAQYSVTESSFTRQLGLIAAAGMGASSVADCLHLGDGGRRVAITFDDGHVTNHKAAELLLQQRGTADFFVNPSTVGKPHYLSWSALREMADAGMSIQSHGFHHVYLDELTPERVHAELADSKAEIEARLGREVTLFAPPGGRQPHGLAALAQRVGYTLVCSSRSGLWERAGPVTEVPRFAVLASTGTEQFQRWIEQDAAELRRQQRRYRWLGTAKRLLGNQRYERLRARLLSLRVPSGAGS